MVKYTLQRWWLTDGWVNIDTFKDRDTAIYVFNGWCRQIRDGTFRIITGSGYVAKKRYGSLYKKVYEKRGRLKSRRR